MRTKEEIVAKLIELRKELEADEFDDEDGEGGWDWSDCAQTITTLEWVLGQRGGVS